MPIDDADIEWLLSLLEAERLAEIEVHDGEQEVLVRGPEAAVALASYLPAAVAAAPAPEAPLPDNVVPILAPMSGLFYRAPSPESGPYVAIGQIVEQGETVGLIEAMKLFNDVTAHVSGTVLKILVDNETQVEAGRALMLIET